ncbi:MAG: family 20 glycosylhydrolase [Promethearchaeota archaeon]
MSKTDFTRSFFLPKPKKLDHLSLDSFFKLDRDSNIFLSRAKVQDHVMDFLGYIWKDFRLNLKITPIHDRDYKDEFDLGFFMYITREDRIPSSFVAEFEDLIKKCSKESYFLKITEDFMYIISKDKRGFFNAVLTVHQLGRYFKVEKDKETGKKILLIPEIAVFDKPDLELRAVHLDLKHQLHSVEYLKDHVRMLARFKINAVIWEWEDKFPYEKRPVIKHPIALTRHETIELMELCQMYGIESIPLVQTFGHLEFVLKHEQYHDLRENKDMEYVYGESTLEICPLHPETMPLLKDMISDVMKYHPRSRFFHIGGDEVYHLGTCPRCREFVEKYGKGDVKKGLSKLYIEHVNRVVAFVKGYGKRPMIWHDYLLKYPEYLDDLDKDVVIVYWRYGRDKNPNDFEAEMAIFKERGFDVLAASSVRSDFQYAIPAYNVRFTNISELNRALLKIPEHVLGSLATSWAVCHAPMETTTPGILYFAEKSWNVDRSDYSSAKLEDFAIQTLKTYFKVPDQEVTKFKDIILLLEQSTVPPKTAKDHQQLLNEIMKASSKWLELKKVMKDGESVVENIIHGLKLQEIKTRFYLLLKSIVQLFDSYGNEEERFPTVLELQDLVRSSDNLLKEFELYRYKTKELYEKVIYDQEIEFELDMQFSYPCEILSYLIDKLELLINKVMYLIEKVKIIDKDDNVARIVDSKTAFTNFYEEFIHGFIKYDSGEKEFPYLDDIESYIEKISDVNENIPDPAMREKIDSLVDALKDLYEFLDDYIFELTLKSVQDLFSARF